MRLILLFATASIVLSAPAAATRRTCRVGEARACGPGEYCAADWREGVCPSEGTCQQYLPVPANLSFSLPIPAGERIYCAKGPMKVGTSTHSACDPATRFAVDLASTAADRPHFVLAPADGVAHVFGGCSSQDLNRQEVPSACNYGFGNIARVEHAPGLYSQVAHLSSLLVQNGARVRRGDVLGLEGNSGNAGAKHLHWSLHRGAARLLLPGPSIPFPQIRFRQAGQLTHASGLTLRCGDFEHNRDPDPESLLESDNHLGRKPPARFGFLRRIDELAIAAVSNDHSVRRDAVAKLRDFYDEATAPYWIGLSYLHERDTRTAEEELQRALQRAERGEGPSWLRPWCLVFLGEVALSQGRSWDARNLFESALNAVGSQDAGLRTRARQGIARINAP